MRYRSVISLLFLGTLTCQLSLGQCPEPALVYKELFPNIQLYDIKQLEKLKNWQNQWQACSFKRDSLYGMLLYRLAAIYLNEDDYYKALSLNVEALKILSISDTRISWVTKVYFKIGSIHLFLKNYELAKKFFGRAIQASTHANHQSYLAESYFYLAYIHRVEGDYILALTEIEKALKNSQNIERTDVLLDTWREKANILHALGQYPKALESLIVAAYYAKIMKDAENLGRIYELTGRTYIDLKANALAVKNYEMALQVLGTINPSLSATININIGNLYSTKEKKYDDALTYFRRALLLTKDNYQLLSIYNNMGYAYIQKKDFENGIRYYQKGYSQVVPNFSAESIDTNPDITSLRRAARKRNLLTLTQDKANGWLEYYKNTKNQNQLKNALKSYLLADKLIDFMRWEQTGDENKLFWRNKTRSIYENAIETCYLLNDYGKAFYFFEKSRAVLLNDKLNELGAKQILSEADRTKEAQLQARIDELRKKSETDKTKSDQTERELLMAENTQSDFIKNLEKTNPAYFRFKYDTTTVSLNQIQQYLKPKESTLIEYFVGDSLTYALVVSPASVHIKTLRFDPNDTDAYLRFCAKDISTKTELNEFLTVSHRLYGNLIAPLKLSKGHLIISQDGAFLPFEAFSLSASKPIYLLNEQAVSYTYSAQFLLKSQPPSNFWPQKSFLGVAPVQFSQKLNTLSGSAESIERIGGSYLWKNELSHQQATKNAFLNQASGHRIVQVYTHAFADSTQTEPHIYFADSALKVSDLGNASFKINLLVLSACKTGVGKVAKGEGVLSLARGFSMAGIPSTITTLWSVEDQTTYSLTELFYTFLNEGLSKDEALQKAKLHYITIHPNAAPATWAGLVLIGDASPLPSNAFWWWGLGGLAGLLILGGIRMKRNFSVKH